MKTPEFVDQYKDTHYLHGERALHIVSAIRNADKNTEGCVQRLAQSMHDVHPLDTYWEVTVRCVRAVSVSDTEDLAS